MHACFPVACRLFVEASCGCGVGGSQVDDQLRCVHAADQWWERLCIMQLTMWGTGRMPGTWAASRWRHPHRCKAAWGSCSPRLVCSLMHGCMVMVCVLTAAGAALCCGLYRWWMLQPLHLLAVDLYSVAFQSLRTAAALVGAQAVCNSSLFHPIVFGN
jgi:hypothetical protein